MDPDSDHVLILSSISPNRFNIPGWLVSGDGHVPQLVRTLSFTSEVLNVQSDRLPVVRQSDIDSTRSGKQAWGALG